MSRILDMQSDYLDWIICHECLDDFLYFEFLELYRENNAVTTLFNAKSYTL